MKGIVMTLPSKGLVFLMFSCPSLFATTRYVAASAGTFSGGTACNGHMAITVATLNLTVLSAGDMTYLCGTISAPAGSKNFIQINQNGTQGNLVSLLFDTGATITATYWSGPVIDVTSTAYVLINGQNTGTIQATANGTNLANQQDNGIGVAMSNCSNCEVKNLTVSDIYVHTCTLPIASCTDEGGQSTYGIQLLGGNNVKVDGNTVHDLKWAIFYAYTPAGNTGFQAFGNTVYNMDHGFVFGDQTASSTGTASIYNNDVSNMGSWDDAGDANHHDGIHSWANFSGSSYTVQDYNNYFHGAGGQGQNTWIYVELTSVNSMIFNNLLTKTDNCPNGGVGLIGLVDGLGNASGTNIVNNTIIGNGPRDGCPAGIGVQNQTGAIIKNNIVMNTGMFIYIPTTGQIAASGINNNLYYNSANGFWCPSNIEVSFAAWQSACGYDANGADSNPNLTSSFTLPSGSPARGLGANLTSMGLTALDTGAPATFGAAGACATACSSRLPTGNWDAGAYPYQNSAMTQPPSGVLITTQ